MFREGERGERMKRARDEGKIAGPMFPRLHVNDTEKGGPRAPPRNKMALYEQLSVPSQRFNHSTRPVNSNSEHASSQGAANERNTFSSHPMPTSRQTEKLYGQFPDFNAPLTQVGQKRKSDEEDFRVPIFNYTSQNHECGKRSNNPHQEKVSCSNPSNADHPLKFQKYKKSGNLESSARQVSKSQTEENSKEITSNRTKAIANSSTIEKAEGPKKQMDSSRDTPVSRINLNESAASLRASPSRDERRSCDLGNDARSQERSFRSISMRNLERADGMSEISVVGSIATVDMTPDDVVGVIGQKHFWKARKAILNQQRVFAVQVFELHRLVKVQKLIAESPELLVEPSAFVNKPMKVAIPRAKIPLTNPVKAIQNVSKQISEPEKPCPDKETSAENATEKASFSSIQNAIPPFTGHSQGPSQTSNPNPGPSPGPWCFNQPPGHQWLIPVMTPSEGLVYKPYPGPGFAGPGPGPIPGPNPAMGNFLTPAYGIPAQHPHPQFPLPPFTPSGPSGPGPHGYFPTYGVPMMNAAAVSNSSVEQMNPRPIPSQASAGEASVGVQHRNGPSKNRAFLDGRSSLHMSRDVDRVRASRETSPVERLEDSRGSNETERANVLPLFPTAPSSDGPRPGPEPDRPSQVIKVVPHNARSATESAARIFQSIQDERKQYDFV